MTGTDGRVRRTVDVEVAGSPMMHDFSLTAGHVVIYDLPVTFDLDFVAKAAPGRFGRPSRWLASQLIGKRRIPARLAAAAMGSGGDGFPYAWNPNYPRVGVMPREGDGSDVRWFDVEPCYVYHPLNAYDDGGDRIVLDVVRHPQMFASDRHGPNEGPPTLDRWTVDLSGGKVIEERLDDRGQEFPRVDERLTGRRHRFGYAPAVGTDAGDIDLTGAPRARPGGGPQRGAVVRPYPPGRRVRVRAVGTGCRRGRWRADGLRARRPVRPHRPRAARRRHPRGRRPCPRAGEDPLRVPRQLDPGLTLVGLAGAGPSS